MMDGEDSKAGMASPDLQKQLADLTKIVEMQVQAMTLQSQMMSASASPGMSSHGTLSSHSQQTGLRQVKVPEGQYNMNPGEFRTYKKDCLDYKKLTQFTNEQVILQMRLNMDLDLKHAIDINYKDTWNELTVDGAITAVGNIVNVISNPAVHRKEFDNMEQNSNKSIKEFITRLKLCSADCNFVCPFNEHHDLTEYHLINLVRSGVANKALQQELLQKCDTLNTLKDITQFCENFESAKNDSEKLCGNDYMISSLEKDDIVAAISNYRKLKKVENQRRDQQTSQINAIFVVMTITRNKNVLHKARHVISAKGKTILPKHVIQ